MWIVYFCITLTSDQRLWMYLFVYLSLSISLSPIENMRCLYRNAKKKKKSRAGTSFKHLHSKKKKIDVPYWIAKDVPSGSYVEDLVLSYLLCKRQAIFVHGHFLEGTHKLELLDCNWIIHQKEWMIGWSSSKRLFILYIGQNYLPVSKMTLNSWAGVPSLITP